MRALKSTVSRYAAGDRLVEIGRDQAGLAAAARAVADAASAARAGPADRTRYRRRIRRSARPRGIGKLMSSSIIVKATLPSPAGIVTDTRLSLVMDRASDRRPFVHHREPHRHVDLPGPPAGPRITRPWMPTRIVTMLPIELALARGLADADLVAQVHRGRIVGVRRDRSASMRRRGR